MSGNDTRVTIKGYSYTNLDYISVEDMIYIACSLNPPGAEAGVLRRTRSIPWLLMPWLLASAGHQQPIGIDFAG